MLGQQCISTYKHFTAIQQLAVKLQDTLELTEEQLDVALSKVSNIIEQLSLLLNSILQFEGYNDIASL